MDYKQRYNKLRVLVSRVNKERKKQAQKIDILCNDFISAQRDFIKKLNTISFSADFYESILGTTDIGSLLYTAGKLIKGEIADANVAFFLHQQDSFELHLSESNTPIAFEKTQLENCFTAEVVDNICKANKLCRLETMFEMGLQGNPNLLNKISAATIPLGGVGPGPGFILIYRSVENELTAEELNHIRSITPGLSQAITACQNLCHLAD